MRFVSAVADPKDAVGAVEPPFEVDYVAFLNNFSAKFDIFVSIVLCPFASGSIAAFSRDFFRKTQNLYRSHPLSKFAKCAPELVIQVKE